MQARGFLNDCLKYFCPKVIHFICQPIELQQEIKQKAGGAWPTQPPNNRHCVDKVQVAVLYAHN